MLETALGRDDGQKMSEDFRSLNDSFFSVFIKEMHLAHIKN